MRVSSIQRNTSKLHTDIKWADIAFYLSQVFFSRDEFKRAFSAATVHDMFNWLTVILLVIVEVITSSISVGYLEFVTGKMVEHLSNEESNSTRSKPPDFLKVRLVKHVDVMNVMPLFEFELFH